MKKLLFSLFVLLIGALWAQPIQKVPATSQGKPLGNIPTGTVAQIFKNDTIYCYATLSAYEQQMPTFFPADTQQKAKQAAILKIKAARIFGQDLIDDFTAENMLLGIAQAKPSIAASLMQNTKGVIEALASGSLHVAIANIKALPPQALDGVYLTSARALIFRRKIEAFLGLPLSANYND